MSAGPATVRLEAGEAAAWLRRAPAGATAIVCGDCLDVLRALPADAVDGVVADPPWNRGKAYGAHRDDLAPGAYGTWLAARLAACARIARGRVVLLPGSEHLSSLGDVLVPAGLRTLAILWWEMADLAGSVQSREPAVVAGRDGTPPAPADLGRHRVGPAGGHPCPKPPALQARLVELAAPRGGTVLDPFAGTGEALRAARDRGRRALGIELEPRYCEAALSGTPASAAAASRSAT